MTELQELEPETNLLLFRLNDRGLRHYRISASLVETITRVSTPRQYRLAISQPLIKEYVEPGSEH